MTKFAFSYQYNPSAIRLPQSLQYQNGGKLIHTIALDDEKLSSALLIAEIGFDFSIGNNPELVLGHFNVYDPNNAARRWGEVIETSPLVALSRNSNTLYTLIPYCIGKSIDGANNYLYYVCSTLANFYGIRTEASSHSLHNGNGQLYLSIPTPEPI